MLYGLATVITDIADDTVTVLESELGCNFRYCGKNRRNDRGVFCSYSIGGGDMLLRHDEAMHGRLRIYVKEGIAGVILVNLLGGNITVDYSTK